MNKKFIMGITISEIDGNIDFIKLKENKVEIVYIKASQGINIFEKNIDQIYAQVKRENFLIGFYHVFYPYLDVKKQVKTFIRAIENKTINAKLVLKIENNYGYSKQALTAECEEFIITLKKIYKDDVIIYVDNAFANEKLENSLSKYEAWIIDNDVDEPNHNRVWDKWIGFQFSQIESEKDKNQVYYISKFKKAILLKGENYNTKSLLNFLNMELLKDTSKDGKKLLNKGDDIINDVMWWEEEVKSEDGKKNKQVYVMKQGDTLEKIAQDFNTDWKTIAEINGIRNKKDIYVGKVLIILI